MLLPQAAASLSWPAVRGNMHPGFSVAPELCGPPPRAVGSLRGVLSEEGCFLGRVVPGEGWSLERGAPHV